MGDNGLFLSDVTNTTPIGLLEKTLAFTEARNKMLATNIANATTPEYRTKQLDHAAFQAELKAAAERRAGTTDRIRIASSEQFEEDDAGFLRVKPTEEPPENLLFHDGTNARIENQMSQLAENTLMNKVATELLRNQFEVLAKSIRGRAG